MDFKFAQQSMGVSPQEIIDVLDFLIKTDDKNTKLNQIENLRSRVQSPHHSEILGQILGALNVPDTLQNGVTVKSPQTGESYPVTNTLIEGYKKELEAMIKMSEQIFNFEKYSQFLPKKKKRGNPFRVLMGKIGKLLDHGLDRRDIIRYMLKEKIWDEKTIEKAIKIVKDYSKKKHVKKTQDKQELTKEAQTLQPLAEVWPRLKKDYSKRSTAELIASIGWLNSLDQMNTTIVDQNMGQEADKSGVKTMIRDIKSELLKRGMSEADLNIIVKKI